MPSDLNTKILVPVSDAIHKYHDQSIQNLLKEHYKMIYSIARRYTTISGFSEEELFAEGVIGLIFAKEKFDSTKGVKFSTYAFYWIKAQILNFIGQFKRKAYTPNAMVNQEQIFHNKNNYINHLVYVDYDNYLVEKEIKDTDNNLDYEINERIKAQIRVVLSLLNSKERYIIQSRWIEEKKTLLTIGQEMNLSTERVRQIEKEAIIKMKKLLADYFGQMEACIVVGSLFFNHYFNFEAMTV